MSARILYPARRICPLPIDIINAKLGTDLAPGDAWLSRAAHRHIARDHPDDYDACLPVLAEAIGQPTWIGQAYWHGENFELVASRIRSVGIILVAIGLQPNTYGNYNIRSAYRIEMKDVDSKRASGALFSVI